MNKEQELRDLLFNIKEDLEDIRKTIDKMIRDIEYYVQGGGNMIILIPKDKEYMLEFHRDLLYYFVGYELNHIAYMLGYDITDIERIENKENNIIIRYLKVEEIKELNDVFPLTIIDEILEEYYLKLEHIPDLDKREEVEEWVIAVKVKEELERIKNIVIEELKERFEHLKQCIFVEIADGDVNKAKEMLKEKYKDYIIVEQYDRKNSI